MGPPSMISGLVWLISRKKLAYAELIMPSMLICVVFFGILINAFEISGTV